ncbi:MAG: TolC family protein [Prevotellaceae bacterium]|jgi:outer membrane protein TolC|nr:TolC family protein [Prevotellaceae bacterium]
MKRTLILFFCCLLVSSACAQLTLQQCQELAQRNYPLVRKYDLIALTQHYNLSNASKGYLPQLTLSGRASYQSDVTELPVDFGALGEKLGMAFEVPALNKGQYSVGIEIDQAIYDGGAIRSRRKLARAEADVSRGRQEVEMYAVREQVNQLYFGILLLDAQLAQNSLHIADLRRTHRQVSTYIYNGIASQADLDAVSVEILALEQKQTGLAGSRTAYVQMLALFTGMQLSDSTTLEMPVDDPTPELSVNNRPELRRMDAQIRQLDARSSLLNVSLRPRVGAFVQGAYGNPGLNMLKNDASAYYVAGMRLSWNFGALYTRGNDLRLLATDRREIDTQRDLFLFNTRLQTTRQQAALLTLRRQMQDDDEMIRLRSNVRRAAEAKVANGVLTVTDMLREITAENLARNAKALHRVQLLKQLYDLKYTLGHESDNPINR